MGSSCSTFAFALADHDKRKKEECLKEKKIIYEEVDEEDVFDTTINSSLLPWSRVSEGFG